MESLVFYTLGIDIPFNEDTSKEFSYDPELCESFIESCVKKILRIIELNGYISLSRVFRILGMKEQITHPNIFFEKFDDFTLRPMDDGSYVVSMYLSGGYEQNVIATKRKTFKPYLVTKREQTSDEPLSKSSESEVLDECQTGQKEISDFEEKEKT